MSPRPRRITDQELLQIATRVVTERGPERVRLADVAAACGLAPATLLQRFGSRERLLQAVSLAIRDEEAATFAVTASSSLNRLKASLTRIAEAAPFGFLVQLGAPEFSRDLNVQIGRCIAAAVENHEIPPCDVAAMARRVQLSFYGEIMASMLERRPVDHGTWTATIDEYGQ